MPVLKGAVQHYHASGQDDARYQIPKIAKSLKFQGYFMCRYGPSRPSAVCVKLLIVSRGGKDQRGIQGTPPRGRVVRLPSMCPTRPQSTMGSQRNDVVFDSSPWPKSRTTTFHCLKHPLNSKSV